MTIWEAIKKRHQPTVFFAAVAIFLLWLAGDQGWTNEMPPEWLMALVGAGVYGLSREVWEWLPFTSSQADNQPADKQPADTEAR